MQIAERIPKNTKPTHCRCGICWTEHWTTRKQWLGLDSNKQEATMVAVFNATENENKIAIFLLLFTFYSYTKKNRTKCRAIMQRAKNKCRKRQIDRIFVFGSKCNFHVFTQTTTKPKVYRSNHLFLFSVTHLLSLFFVLLPLLHKEVKKKTLKLEENNTQIEKHRQKEKEKLANSGKEADRKRTQMNE